MEHKIIVCDVVRFSGYWGGGETIAQARAEFKKNARRYPSAKANWILVIGEDARKASIGEMGYVNYPATCKYFQI